MQMQPFEVVANALALVVLVVLAAIHVYGRSRFEPPEDDVHRSHR